MASLRFQEQAKEQLIDEEGKNIMTKLLLSLYLTEQKKLIANYEAQDEQMSRRAKVRFTHHGIIISLLSS